MTDRTPILRDFTEKQSKMGKITQDLVSPDGDCTPSDTTGSQSDTRQSLFSGVYGWLVVATCFLLQMVSVGTAYTFGVIFVPLEKEFQADKTSIAWIGSIQAFLMELTSLLAAPMMIHFGWRITVITGSIVAAVGYVTSAMATTINVLYLTYGILTGVGFGLIYPVTVVAIPYIFDQWMPLAVGITMSGSGVGLLLFGYVTQALIDTIQWRWTLVVEAGLVLLAGICGILIRKPDNRGSKCVAIKHQHHNERTGCESREETLSIPSIQPRSGTLCHKLGMVWCDPHLCSKGGFLLFCLANTLLCFCYNTNMTYLPVRAQAYGIPAMQASSLISMFGISNVVGRFIFITISNSACRRFYLGGVVLLLGGLITLSSWLWVSHPLMLAYSCIYGLVTGCFLGLYPQIMVDLVGIKLVEKATCVYFCICSLAFMCASPLSAWIIERSGSYELPFIVVGAMQVFGAGLYFLVTREHHTYIKRGSIIHD